MFCPDSGVCKIVALHIGSRHPLRVGVWLASPIIDKLPYRHGSKPQIGARGLDHRILTGRFKRALVPSPGPELRPILPAGRVPSAWPLPRRVTSVLFGADPPLSGSQASSDNVQYSSDRKIFPLKPPSAETLQFWLTLRP